VAPAESDAMPKIAANAVSSLGAKSGFGIFFTK